MDGARSSGRRVGTVWRRRLPAVAAAVCGVLAVLLGVAAVLLGGQTAPTEPAVAARAHVAGLVDVARSAAGLPRVPIEPVDAAACPWLGLPGLPASDQVRPTVDLALPVPADPVRILDAVAGALRDRGVTVGRGPAGLEARDAAGYALTVRIDDGWVLRAQAPCVWPDGERRAG